MGESEDLYISCLADWEPPTGRVLVVEDDPIIMQLVKDVIEEEGYSVVSAQDGREAYQILERDDKFDAGIFDVMIPTIQGTDLVRYMQTAKRLSKIPVLIMTSEQSAAIHSESFSAGAAIFLPKPFTPRKPAEDVPRPCCKQGEPKETATLFELRSTDTSPGLAAPVRRRVS